MPPEHKRYERRENTQWTTTNSSNSSTAVQESSNALREAPEALARIAYGALVSIHPWSERLRTLGLPSVRLDPSEGSHRVPPIRTGETH